MTATRSTTASKKRVCPACGCHIQRTVTGAVDDGMVAHYKVVHPYLSLPVPAKTVKS